MVFQHQAVRAFIEFYFNFTLPMDRSPGFGSTLYNFVAHFRLGFPTASSLNDLTLLYSITRWPVLQKVRRHPHGAPTACKHKVSGSISLPSRGSFHLSLTVLVHYRLPSSI